MAEKMFAHQISERGLADAVRVTSAGTGDWHVGSGADERAGRVLRAHGYPTDHRAAQVDDDHLAADLVVALGRNHVRMLRQLGVDDDRIRMLRSFDPRSGAHALDVDDPYYGDHDDFEDVYAVIEAALPGLHDWVDEQLASTDAAQLMRRLALPAAAGLDGAGSWWSSRSPICVSPCSRRGSSARTPGRRGRTTRSQQSADRRAGSADNVLPQQDSSAPDAAVAPGDRHRALPARRAGAGPVAGGRRRTGVRGAGAVRRSTAGRRVLVDRGYVRPEQGSRVPPIRAAAAGHGDHHRAAARLRTPSCQGKEPFTEDGAQQVYSINTGQIADADRRPAGRVYLQLVDNQPGGLGVIALPHLDAGPFLSYGIQWIAFGIIAPIGWATSSYSEIRAPPRARRAAHDAPTPRPRAAHRRGETRRPLRPTALSRSTAPAPPRPPAPPATAAPPGAGRPTVGGRPSPSVGPDLAARARTAVGPPSRTPSAPANAASDDAGVGAGMTGGVATPRPQRPDGDPPTSGAHSDHQRGGHPGGDVVGSVIQSRCGPTESGVARRAVADHRVERVDGAVHQHRRALRRPRPTAAAPPARRRCSPRPTPARPGSARGIEQRRVAAAQRRQQPPGAVDVAAVQQLGHRPGRCAPATFRPARPTSPPRYAAGRSAPGARQPHAPEQPSATEQQRRRAARPPTRLSR